MPQVTEKKWTKTTREQTLTCKRNEYIGWLLEINQSNPRKIDHFTHRSERYG